MLYKGDWLNIGIVSSGSLFYQHGLGLIPVWISNYIRYKVQDEIAYPSPNVNRATVEAPNWIISYFITHFTGHVIAYSSWD